MTFEDRQRQTMADYKRSSFGAPMSYTVRPRPATMVAPPGVSRQSKRLDEIAAESARQRQQRDAIAAMEAEMTQKAKA